MTRIHQLIVVVVLAAAALLSVVHVDAAQAQVNPLEALSSLPSADSLGQVVALGACLMNRFAAGLNNAQCRLEGLQPEKLRAIRIRTHLAVAGQEVDLENALQLCQYLTTVNETIAVVQQAVMDGDAFEAVCAANPRLQSTDAALANAKAVQQSAAQKQQQLSAMNNHVSGNNNGNNSNNNNNNNVNGQASGDESDDDDDDDDDSSSSAASSASSAAAQPTDQQHRFRRHTSAVRINQQQHQQPQATNLNNKNEDLEAQREELLRNFPDLLSVFSFVEVAATQQQQQKQKSPSAAFNLVFSAIKLLMDKLRAALTMMQQQQISCEASANSPMEAKFHMPPFFSFETDDFHGICVVVRMLKALSVTASEFASMDTFGSVGKAGMEAVGSVKNGTVKLASSAFSKLSSVVFAEETQQLQTRGFPVPGMDDLMAKILMIPTAIVDAFPLTATPAPQRVCLMNKIRVPSAALSQVKLRTDIDLDIPLLGPVQLPGFTLTLHNAADACFVISGMHHGLLQMMGKEPESNNSSPATAAPAAPAEQSQPVNNNNNQNNQNNGESSFIELSMQQVPNLMPTRIHRIALSESPMSHSMTPSPYDFMNGPPQMRAPPGGFKHRGAGPTTAKNDPRFAQVVDRHFWGHAPPRHEHNSFAEVQQVHRDPAGQQQQQQQQQAQKQEMKQELDVFVGTWNLHGKPPPDDLSTFIPPDKFDMYVLGTEECENSIQKSFVFNSKDKWVRTLLELLGDSYVVVAESNLVALHVIVLIRVELAHEVWGVESVSVATGFADRLGNKGAVAVSMRVGATSMLFVNCHFHAHQHNVEQRNADYHKINERLAAQLTAPVTRATTTPQRNHLSAVDYFDRVVWMGDLNYRIEGNRAAVDALLEADMHEALLNNDQLNKERLVKRSVFHKFYEAPITFAPTYKFDSGTDVYDTSAKARIPSFTDRILVRSNNDGNGGGVEVLKYDSVMSIRTSDHKPVFAHLRIKTQPVKLFQ
eukprot:TRINITY_DN67561_c7_g1_i1.p1 TRINITY_DN67561_c7_g1~~TRINITY_DN67561_c7_g1_i1.p1  ORF type:complete len:989 (+),score=558.98 TRINITY_DN67561_c7_g1_i1:3-2969(+)